MSTPGARTAVARWNVLVTIDALTRLSVAPKVAGRAGFVRTAVDQWRGLLCYCTAKLRPADAPLLTKPLRESYCRKTIGTGSECEFRSHRAGHGARFYRAANILPVTATHRRA
jgi:hypothetical protein